MIPKTKNIEDGVTSDINKRSKFNKYYIGMTIRCAGGAKTLEEAISFMPKIYEYLDKLVDNGVLVRITKGMSIHGYDGFIVTLSSRKYGVKLDSGYTCEEVHATIQSIILDTRELIENQPYYKQLVDAEPRPVAFKGALSLSLLVVIYSTILVNYSSNTDKQLLLLGMLFIQILLLLFINIHTVIVDNMLINNRAEFLKEVATGKYSSRFSAIKTIDDYGSKCTAFSMVLIIIQMLVFLM